MLLDGLHDIPKGKVAMIVTHLEMRAPVQIAPISLPDGVNFRGIDATPDWFRDIFFRVGSSDWLWYGRLEQNDEELGALLNDPLLEHYTLRCGGQDEALLELDFRKGGECELSYFGLTPALIGTGSGRYLMNQAIARAWTNPITRFHVHTCTLDSPQALGFYQRSGFTATHQQVEIDDDPRVTGVLPTDAGPKVPIFAPKAAT